jgi:prepilin-type N-terminal cleavage/methylation domain-containing protein
MRQRGFTLIETIITLTIMAVLTVFAARTIQQAFVARAKIQDQIDSVGQVKDVLRMIERDINLAYHYLDIELEQEKELKRLKNKKTTATATPQPDLNPDPIPEENPPGSPQSGGLENRIDPTTHFVGKENEIHFVTSNVVRFMKDSPQADFGEVSYFVDSCRIRPEQKFESGKCLFRRTSPIIDKDVTKGGASTQLLADVTEFKLQYYSRLQKDWRKDWNSKAEGGDTNTRDRYPEAVEVNLTVEHTSKKMNNKEGKTKKISIQMIVSVHNPNNKEPASNPNAAGNTNAQ